MSVLPVGIGSSGGYTISRSVRLRQSASAYFSRTNTNAPTNAKIGTLSMWVKRGSLATGNSQYLIETGTGASNNTYFTLFFDTSNNINSGQYSETPFTNTSVVFRDPSAWYHIVITYDSTQATASNRFKLYVNNQLLTSSTTITQNNEWAILKASQLINIGRHTSVARHFDGYLTEINLIDGQALTPSSFGETDTITGVWKPKKYTGTYGTNGFYLNFSDNSATTATTIGKDYSGNGNNWTPNNISITAGATYDSMLDSPTVSSTSSNYAVLNPLNKDSSQTVSDGNLTYTGSASLYGKVNGTIGMSSGKWYWEATLTGGGGSLATTIGIATAQSPLNASPGDSGDAYGWGYYNVTGNKYNNGTSTAYGSTYTTNDVIGVAFDADAGTLTFYKNNTSQGTAFSSLTSGPYFPSVGDFATTSYPIWAFNFGQRPFTYTPPTGFKALNTQNLPDATIKNGASYMAATLYTGNASTQTISNAVNGISFQPDLVWTKSRGNAYSHDLYDSIRGVNKKLQPNQTAAETTVANSLTSFNSNGYTLGSQDNSNFTNGSAAVGWQWNAGGSTVTNTSGSISSQVRANPSAGFSIVTYTGTGANATVGHGLGVAPRMMIVKNRTTATGWLVYHASVGNTGALILNGTNATVTSVDYWNNTTPTSSVFTVGVSNAGNQSTNNLVAYCFAEVAGYSKFGSYTGNGSTDGPFVYLGFRPRWVLLKVSSTTGDWVIYDTSRNTYNVVGLYLYPNSSAAEGGSGTPRLDILSNGFKLRNTGQDNTSSATYIYAAFAENPFKHSLAR